ncbi:MAG TPA: hypothetical protein PK513_06200 [Alphaproteobacteria bacterium]|nr:hypothetical protein [Alphaproteobacteria bacterium]USO06128.1 MAG: hypothetical protein H6859_02730 [Rhodospirillales bacterium]HOO82074.1 hypothetical protein [Alphaproteobacteria bacterium]
MDLTFILYAVFLLAVVVLAIYHRNKDQKKVMNYYEHASEKGDEVAKKSLENQKRMIELLETISKKLDK